MARPRIKVDLAIVLRLRDVEHLGWSLVAETYRVLIGQFVSRETVERRYDEAKEQQAKLAAKDIQASPPICKKPQLVFEPITASPRIVEISGKKWVMTKKRPGHTVSKPPEPTRQAQSQLRLFQ